MKKVCVCAVIGLIAMAISMQNASALPPFNKEWTAKYVEGNSNAKFVEAVGTAKCNVCHMGASKKDRNEYGKAVSKYLTKAKYNEIKEDEAAGRKYILEGLQKAEGEKSSSGKTYGEMFKAGQLPSS
jgi:hypothetical protein